jgi:hypothetical protein
MKRGPKNESDRRHDPVLALNRVKCRVASSATANLMNQETFDQYWTICKALGEFKATAVLRIIINAQYDAMCESGEITDEE